MKIIYFLIQQVLKIDINSTILDFVSKYIGLTTGKGETVR
jgi:hypothetical protein